jgi:hypothetical protein
MIERITAVSLDNWSLCPDGEYLESAHGILAINDRLVYGNMM